MMDIQINKVGLILHGSQSGWFVKVVDDSAESGGFLVFTADNQEMRGAFDGWVEKYEDLPQYFSEKKWQIEWLPRAL